MLISKELKQINWMKNKPHGFLQLCANTKLWTSRLCCLLKIIDTLRHTPESNAETDWVRETQVLAGQAHTETREENDVADVKIEEIRSKHSWRGAVSAWWELVHSDEKNYTIFIFGKYFVTSSLLFLIFYICILT